VLGPMQTHEYYDLERVEEEHWFYRGKRDMARLWIERLADLRPEDLLIDVGVGTGRFLAEMRGRCRLLGCDPSPVALRMASSRAGNVVASSIAAIPIRPAQAKVVTALDVIEHVEDHRACLEELIRIVRPGGLIVINVPAFQALWSDWDVSLGHKRRYVKRTFLALVDPAKVTVLRCTYTSFFVFFPILLYRFLRSRFGLFRGSRMEDRVPPRLLNKLLYALYVWPAMVRWFAPPWGSSLFVILRKTEAGLVPGPGPDHGRGEQREPEASDASGHNAQDRPPRASSRPE
jgi:SAM-dependent methyltransferase